MKAIVQGRYGLHDVLRLPDVEISVASDDGVLVRVQAAAVNIGDSHLLRGTPYVMRIATGPFRPRHHVPGLDLAGRVESVGKDVTRFRPGDEVFGWCRGAFAEYACAGQGNFQPKPANLTLEQSAAVGDSAFTALNAVRDQGNVQPGHEVLINGASGGVGTFAVQIAKSFGAEVTGVCSTRNIDLVRSIGADHVIDYTQRGLHSRHSALRRDTRSGREPFIVRLQAGADIPRDLRPGWGRGHWSLVRSRPPDQGALVVTVGAPEDACVHRAAQPRGPRGLKELVEAGKVAPVIDRRYDLSQVPEALRYPGEGHARGKLVITV